MDSSVDHILGGAAGQLKLCHTAQNRGDLKLTDCFSGIFHLFLDCRVTNHKWGAMASGEKCCIIYDLTASPH
jgi:hypothetical protein